MHKSESWQSCMMQGGRHRRSMHNVRDDIIAALHDARKRYCDSIAEGEPSWQACKMQGM